MASATQANAAPDNTDKLRRRANRRLLGASVLLLIAIIAVPLFLEREPPPLPDNVDVRIPAIDGSRFEPKLPDAKKGNAAVPEIPVITEPSGAQAGAPPVASVATAAAVAGAAAAKGAVTRETQMEAAKEALKEAPPSEPKAPTKDAPKAPPKAVEKPAPVAVKEAAKEVAKEPPKEAAKEIARKPGQLVVQVIAVRDAVAAKESYDKARALKFPTYTETIDVANGKVTRVRVGPYDTPQAAEKARAKLAQSGFEAKVITLQ
jgi:DedD protein